MSAEIIKRVEIVVYGIMTIAAIFLEMLISDKKRKTLEFLRCFL